MTDWRATNVVVWDPFVRVYHWTQAALIAAAWITAGEWKSLHETLGYAIAALVALRVAWGFAGPEHARFADFVRSPRTVFRYLGDLSNGREPRMLGHNPAGGAMIVALLGTIAATILTGWLQTSDTYWRWRTLADVHTALATVILFLVGAHVVGVLLGCWRHRENLVKAMITGRKRPLAADDAE